MHADISTMHDTFVCQHTPDETCRQTWPLIGYNLHFVRLFEKQST